MRNRAAIALLSAASMVFASTAAAAAPAPTTQADPWAVLSVMSGGASAAAACGAPLGSAAGQSAGNCVLQPTNAPPGAASSEPPEPIPVPPVAAPAGGLGISPILLGLAAIAAAVGLYLVIHHRGNSPS